MKLSYTNKNILFLECRGCYFWDDDEIKNISDVGNYRVGIAGELAVAKNKRSYYLEFTYYNKRKTRYTHKITGKPLKNPITYIEIPYALHLDTEFEAENHMSYRDLKLENQIHELNYLFTKENILKVVNKISVKKFDCIIMISDDVILPFIESIYNKGDYREKNIIENLIQIKTKQRDKDYLVFSFIDNKNNTFDYEYHSRRITG